MRSYQMLDQIEKNVSTGLLIFSKSAAQGTDLSLAFRKEGKYAAISASFGPIEIGLRPQLDEFTRTLSLLQPVDGLRITRQVGTTESNIGLGLQSDGTVLLRPTIVADATGHLSFNLSISSEGAAVLREWMSS